MSIIDTAQGILDHIVDTIPAPPDRQYITLGQAAWDCEQVVVALTGLGKEGATAAGTVLPVGCSLTAVTATVLQTWCVPIGNETGNTYRPPTTEALAAAGATAVDATQELWHATVEAAAAADCGAQIVEAVALGPEGGFVGFQITIQWALTSPLP